MTTKKVESCGRCSVTTVVDASHAGKDSDEVRERNILGDAYIEIDESDLRTVAPHLFIMDRLQGWLDDIGWRLTYNR